MIFDIKLGVSFRPKARLVAGEHNIKPPLSITYSSVVLRDLERICLLIAELNDLDIQSSDIENSYLKSPCRDKIWYRAGTKFGQDEGKVFIIVIEFYGLKPSRSAFIEFLSKQLDKMGFKSSIAHPDI